jgi:hypothetical protein
MASAEGAALLRLVASDELGYVRTAQAAGSDAASLASMCVVSRWGDGTRTRGVERLTLSDGDDESVRGLLAGACTLLLAAHVVATLSPQPPPAARLCLRAALREPACGRVPLLHAARRHARVRTPLVRQRALRALATTPALRARSRSSADTPGCVRSRARVR